MSSKLRLILTWNIRPGQEQEYSIYVNDRLAPGLMEIGLPPYDVYYTTYGDAPQIMVALNVSSLALLEKALKSPRWQALKQDLLQYVEDYQERVIKASGGDEFF